MAYERDMMNVLAELGVTAEGLSSAEASQRLKVNGFNLLESRERPTPLSIFFRQFLNPLVYVLVVAASIKAYVKGPLDALVIVGVLLFMAIVGFIQEMRAESAMASLLRLAAPKAKVLRNGSVEVIESRLIAPGDIVILETGDKIPADARLIEAVNLKINESSLTGESLPVVKHTNMLASDSPLAERRNMVFMGTTIAYGRGKAVVTATGMQTQIGRIAGAVRTIRKDKTSLQKSIDDLGHALIWIVLGFCTILLALGLWKGMDFTEVFMLAVAAAVAAIPESLPAVVTIVLAMGMQRMARNHAIIRKLIAVETLGSTTVICSDKTGTLTLNQMTVERIYTHDQWTAVSGHGYDVSGEFVRAGKPFSYSSDPALVELLKSAVLCNDARLVKSREGTDIQGDPTEGALVVLAEKAGLSKAAMEKGSPRLEEIPFESEKQYMVTLHREDAGLVARVKGAIEKILPMASHYLDSGREIPLTEDVRRQFISAAESMSKDALRVLAFGYARVDSSAGGLSEQMYRGKLVLAGLGGMIDPHREEVVRSIRLCHAGGIKVVMATGDNKVTAKAIAQAIGIKDGEVWTGQDLQKISDEELERSIEKVSVFARIEPLHKLRIVQAFKKRGHVVAMTGDGVNDAPALEAADIGIAMGITGTDVAKESSDMVLADDNFSSIVTAVEEGRAIFNRLRNVLLFMLTTCFGELLVLLLGVFMIGHAPLVPLQILWINLVTGAIMAIPLGMEPRVGDELDYPPRSSKVGLIYPGMLFRVAFLAGMLALGSFAVFAWAYTKYELHEARTLTFCAIVMFEWLVAFNARSDQRTIFRLGLLKNRPLFVALLIAIPLQLAVVYVPFLHEPFDTVPLKAWEWGIALIPGFAIFIIETLRKVFFPQLFNKGKLS